METGMVKTVAKLQNNGDVSTMQIRKLTLNNVSSATFMAIVSAWPTDEYQTNKQTNKKTCIRSVPGACQHMIAIISAWTTDE